MKKLLLLLALLSITPSVSSAYSGACGITYRPKGQYVPQYTGGDTLSFGVARDRCIARGGGTIWIGIGCENLTFNYPSGAGLVVIKESASQGMVIDPLVGSTVGNGIISRLGPASSLNTGGAIRVIDGVVFPLSQAGIQAALDDLPSTGGMVLLPGAPISGITTLKLQAKTTLAGFNPLVTTLIRDPAATGPAIREKTVGEGNAGGATGIVIRDLSVWGNGSTGNGIDLGNQGGASFNSPAYISDVLVRDFTSGIGMNINSNATNNRDLWAIHNNIGFSFAGGASYWDGLMGEANTVTQLRTVAPWDTYSHVQLEHNGYPSTHMVEMYNGSASGINIFGLYMSLGFNSGNLVVEYPGANNNVYESVSVNTNGFTWNNTVYDSTWNSGTGAVPYISKREDNANLNNSYWYDKSTNKTSRFTGPDLNLGGKLTVAGAGAFLGDASVAGNLSVQRSMSADSLQVTTILKALNCLISMGKLLVHDSTRVDGALVQPLRTLADNTTPDVSAGNNFKCSPAGATTITNFVNATAGQVLRLIFTNANASINDSAPFLLNTGFTSAANKTLVLLYDGTSFFELARSPN